MATDTVAIGVVVAILDGTRKRGFVYDLRMERGDFHLFYSTDLSDQDPEENPLAQCKAVLFVKSLAGNHDYQENKMVLMGNAGVGKPFEAVFSDGEVIRGRVESYDEKRIDFYLVPPDLTRSPLPPSTTQENYSVPRGTDRGTQMRFSGAESAVTLLSQER
ncbi:MAG: DUF6982 domain-containing protein [Planctomycetota bacterium]